MEPLNGDDRPHLPPPSLWPVGFAVGVACVLVGLIVDPLVVVPIGVAILLVFGFLWARDATKGYRAPVPGASSRFRLSGWLDARMRRAPGCPGCTARDDFRVDRRSRALPTCRREGRLFPIRTVRTARAACRITERRECAIRARAMALARTGCWACSRRTASTPAARRRRQAPSRPAPSVPRADAAR